MTQEEINNALDDVLRFGGQEVLRLLTHMLTQSGLLASDTTDTTDTSSDTTDTVVANRRKGN